MTRRTFTVIDIVEILVHWACRKEEGGGRKEPRSGPGHRGEVHRQGRGRGLSTRDPRRFLPRRGGTSSHRWFPELVDPRERSLTHQTIDVFRPDIEQMLKTNTATTVHQRLRDERGLTVSVTSFRRYVWREFPEENLRNIATPPRPEVPPGDEAQIDYGYLGSWLDPLTERMRRVWAFVMVLAFSRHMFVRPVFVMDQRAWTQCHMEAFSFFGGVPLRLVPENVPRNIFGLLLPTWLCGHDDGELPMAAVNGRTAAVSAT